MLGAAVGSDDAGAWVGYGGRPGVGSPPFPPSKEAEKDPSVLALGEVVLVEMSPSSLSPEENEKDIGVSVVSSAVGAGVGASQTQGTGGGHVNAASVAGAPVPSASVTGPSVAAGEF